MDILLAMAPPADGQGGGGGMIGTILMVLILLVVIYSVFSLMFGTKIPFLVLRSIKMDPDDSMNEFILIKGRRSGLFAWFFTSSRLEDETYLRCTEKEIEFGSSSFAEESLIVVANKEVASAVCTFHKPLVALIFGIIFFSFGLIAMLSIGLVSLVFIIISILFFAFYSLGKKITIIIETSGGSKFGLSFKRSVIENVTIDQSKAIQIIKLLNKKIIESKNFH